MTCPSIIYPLGVDWWAIVDEPLSQIASNSRPHTWEPPSCHLSHMALPTLQACTLEANAQGRLVYSDRPHLCSGTCALRGTLPT